MKHTVIVRPDALDEAIVYIEWQEPFTRHFTTKTEFGDRLERLPGVEHIYINLYSAQLVLAPHVITWQKLLPHIMELFRGFGFYLQRQTTGNVPYEFEVIPAVPMTS